MFGERDTAVERCQRDTNGENRSVGRRGRLRRGAEGGALATFVMTAHRLPVKRSLPPSGEFWAKFVAGGDAEDHPVAALVLHFAYGVGGGVLFTALLPSREPVGENPGDRGPPSRSGEVSATVYGFLYGLVLSVIGEYVVLGALLDIEPDDRFVFHVGHVLYGITLGAWVGTRTREG